MSQTPTEIEVKFAVAPGDLSAVLKSLPEMPGTVEEYTVHFFDRKPLLLFGKGLIVRMRQRPGKTDDATFKVRGKGAGQAFTAFGDSSDKERKLEGDQNVNDAVKESFSITSEPPLAEIEDVLAGKARLSNAFDPDASNILKDAGLSWDGVGVYGPIRAKRWKTKIAGVTGKVTVELWTTTSAIELLEVSDKVDAGNAKEFGDKLSAHMLAVPGVKQLLGKDDRPASKTEFALMNSDYRPLAGGVQV